MKKRVNLKNRVSALVLSFFLASGLIAPTFSITASAEAIEVLESSATVADCVMTYYAMSGSAIANTEWINTLYDSLGSSFGTIGDFANNSLMTYVDGVWQPTETLVQNIENASAYTELGLNQVFNVSAEEVANGGGYAVATGASTLAGAAGCIATNGILPVLGGVTAAYWGGIGVGTLINHLVNEYSKSIYNGVNIDISDLVNSLPDGYSCCTYVTTSNQRIFDSCNGRIGFVRYRSGTADDGLMEVYKGSGSVIIVNRKNLSTNSNTDYSYTLSNKYYRQTFGGVLPDSGRPILFDAGSYSNAETYYSKLKDGTISFPVPYSPDVIGENGNQQAEYDPEAQKYSVPDFKPQIDPGTESGKVLSLQDWLNFANGVKNNNSNVDPISENANLFQDLINALKMPIPSPGPSPDPNPGPTPDPNPGGETYPVPGPVPDPSPVPDPDYQPETKPQPEYTEKPTENETDITEGDPWTTPDLLDKFPFCIPRDVYRVFTKLDSGARAAPHIQWRFNPNNLIDYTFDIDFSDFDSVAQLLRTLELLGFIVALAVATRTMILS